MLAQRLKSLRDGRGVSLQFVADATGISKPHIWQLETAKARNPSIDTMVKLAAFYEVSTEYPAGCNSKRGNRYHGFIKEISKNGPYRR